MMNEPSLGRVIAERRAGLGLSLKDLGRLVHKEDGHGVSAQYLHDIERDRRTPSPHVLSELARALGVDPYYLAAVAGQCPAELTLYLREHPECGPAVAAMFSRARTTGFADWDTVAPTLQPVSEAR
jgi:transcriptional regulator with XRE-family HTH domain